MLRVDRLSRRWGGFSLDDISLEVGPGRYGVLLGPSGAGKTLLLETLAGFHRPDSGRVFLEGRDATRLPPQRRGIGFVYQQFALFPHMSVRRNIEYGLRGRHDEAARRRVDRVVDLLGLRPFLDRRPQELSGGEKQRAAIARALALGARTLLLDEPFSSLDHPLRMRLIGEMKRIHAELRPTILHVTHDFEETLALAEWVAVMHRGKILQSGHPEEVFRKPACEEVARFLHAENLFRGEISRAASENGGPEFTAVVRVGDIEIAAVGDHEGKAFATIRPEEVILSRQPLHTSARNCFRGTIVGIVNGAAVSRVTVRIAPDFSLVAIVTRTSVRDMDLRAGEEVYAAFKASAVHTF